ncbi:TVP38/TMEM64 family protein [Leptolyngbya sp. AN02str]|uniref:TVP38/TMEM64 family protein n=1 Tax=Leptolyngbya sp. AN02str TaxID=3423363 RepID=UPI003D310D13
MDAFVGWVVAMMHNVDGVRFGSGAQKLERLLFQPLLKSMLKPVSKPYRLALRSLTVGAIAYFMVTLPAWAQGAENAASWSLQDLLRNALAWIDGLGVIGGLAFIGIYIVATVAFLPGSILTLGAGVVFGVLAGSVYVFIGATLGAIAAFLVGRYLARGWIYQKIEGNQRFSAIDQAVAEEGSKIVLLTRLSPVFPFNLLNYAFGITGVSLKDYALGSVGMIPGTVMYVYLGSLAGDLARIGSENQPTNPTVQWAIRILGFVATVAVTVYVTRIARKALAERVSEL